MSQKMSAPKRSKRRRKVAASLDDPEFRKRFDREQKKYQKQIQPLIDAARRSEQITERDLRVVINARSD